MNKPAPPPIAALAADMQRLLNNYVDPARADLARLAFAATCEKHGIRTESKPS